MRVPIDKVPMDVRRRAARLLQSLAESAPGKRRTALAEARLGAEATPLHRPDVEEVAYWEIEVLGVATTLPTVDGEPRPFDRGFIVVATAAHDVPLPHFSVELAPPSRQLEQFGDLARVVKLDALCYVGEDAHGTMLGHIGTVPPKLDGLPETLPRKLPEGWATTAAPVTENDEVPVDLKLRSSREQRIGVTAWRSWEELQASYSATYRLHLAALASRAEHPWNVEALTEKFGQGIREGEHVDVPLLQRGDVSLDGPGAAFVDVAVTGDRVQRARLTARRPDGSDTTFRVTFSYGETLTFFVLPADAPTETVPAESPLGPTMTGALR